MTLSFFFAGGGGGEVVPSFAGNRSFAVIRDPCAVIIDNSIMDYLPQYRHRHCQMWVLELILYSSLPATSLLLILA